jgi:lauroyl/myristoyl acyltransferase
MSPWKSFRYWLEEMSIRLLTSVIPLIPRRALVALANGLGALAFRLDTRGRTVSLANLECAFGERFTLEERRDLARRSYQNFVRTMSDLFWAGGLDEGTWREWIEPAGFDEIRAQMAREKRGAIFLCVHQGNWEWASLACGFLGFSNMVVAGNFKNPRLTELFRAHRQGSGQMLIAQENSLLRMLRAVKRGGATGMLIDLNLRPDQAATIIDTHGGLKMCVPLLHAVLADRAKALLVPVETQPLADGRCRVIAHAPVEVPEGASVPEIAQRCWNAFEPIVNARPEEYLWSYKHFRYRPRNTTRSYPDYSNESGKFEKALINEMRVEPSGA